MAEHEHTKTDGLGDGPAAAPRTRADEAVHRPAADAPLNDATAGSRRTDWRAPPRSERMAADKVECNACPVLCQISVGKVGACDRYANQQGQLVRVDPVLVVDRRLAAGDGDLVPFLLPTATHAASEGAAWPDDAAMGANSVSERAIDGGIERVNEVVSEGVPANAFPSTTANVAEPALFVTAVGAGTTYPDYKPAPFIVTSVMDGVDMVTVVTEGIFSYCSMKVKIDTDRWLGPEQANVRCRGEVVGHVSTAEYGSQMLSLGGVHHITGGSKKEGRVTAEALQLLGNKQAVAFSIDGGAQLCVQAGQAPVIDGRPERRMRVGCGSATVGIFAQQFVGLADEVVVVDDHITGVLTEHQAGRCLRMRPSGLQVRGRKSTPGRYFQVANSGTGWGGTDIHDPLAILDSWDPTLAWPGQRLLMVSTTGEHAAWYTLDAALCPQPADMPASVRAVVERIGENCEPSLCSVLFLGGAGGSLRAGVTDNPIRLTQAIKRALVNVTCGGAPAYVWPGGGITVMVDVLRMPDQSFGTVPTPALVAPIEFSMRLDDYAALGGHMAYVRPLAEVLASGAWHPDGAPTRRRMVAPPHPANPWPLGQAPMLG